MFHTVELIGGFRLSVCTFVTFSLKLWFNAQSVFSLSKFTTAYKYLQVSTSIYCEMHALDQELVSRERLDTRLTRKARRDLGIDLFELTTGSGCRKEPAIATSKSRSKTCGLLYAYRCCGISLGLFIFSYGMN